jgi:hypothetical protein
MQNRKLLENMATMFSAFHNTHISGLIFPV